MYMRNVHIPSDNIESCRFKLENLSELYQEMRYNTGEKGMVATLDSQSFINILVLALRQGRVPLCWKYINFEQITFWANKFAIQPLGELSQKAADSPTMYQSQSKSLNSAALRTWVDWKKIMTFFVLLGSPIPNESEIADYRVKLSDQGQKQFVNKSQFVMVSRFIIISGYFYFRPKHGLISTKANQIQHSNLCGLLREKQLNQKQIAATKKQKTLAFVHQSTKNQITQE